MFGQRSRNARRHRERRTAHRHSSGVVRTDRTGRIDVPSSRSVDERTGAARARSAQRRVPGGTDVRRVGRSGSADAGRGTDASTDSAERSGRCDHHGRPPFGLELVESSGSNVRPFATSEHYRHRKSERNPFFGKRLELHSRTGRSRCEVRVLVATRRLRAEFPSCIGAGPAGCTVRCLRTGGSLRARCGIAGLHGAGNLAPCDGARTEHARCTHGARRRPGTESVPGLRRACERTRPRRAPRRSPSGSHPRRRSARCHPRSPRPRPRVSRCGRRPRAG